jgi:lambda family phage portal protein
LPTNWLDRLTSPIAPVWTLKRQRARAAAHLLARHYEAASSGRRTRGWRRSSADVNAVVGPALSRLRDVARDLVRNNAFAESALSIIVDHTVGYGITPRALPKNATAEAAWKAWGETTACDADGRHDFYGLQKLVMRTAAESGEVLIRRRFRRMDPDGTVEGGLPLPLQLQVLDPDFIDTSKDTLARSFAGRAGTQNTIIQGVEFDAIGRRVAYWLFKEHPGSLTGSFGDSVRVPAESVLHVFRGLRPGQVRGPSWFAPVLLRFKDFDELADAALIKQKIAACLAIVTTDVDGSAPALGTADDTDTPGIDALEPGAILNIPPGRSVDVVEPPQVREYGDFSKTILRELASGLGVTYEDLTGDYSDMNFSSSRASHLKHWQRVDEWRWRMLIPQFCDPAFAWFVQAATIAGQIRGEVTSARWSPPPTPMVDPVNEGLAYQRNIRNGFQTLPEVIRELGYDPQEQFDEIADTNATLDRLKIVLDSDPRRMTQAGQAQAALTAVTAPADAEQSRGAVLHAISRR